MRWYRRLFRRARTERQLDSELRFHLEQQIADYIAAGTRPEEARRLARLEFGGLDQVKEECRDVGAARFIETLFRDLRYGLRQLRRNPGFTAVAIITLALGIGASTAMFSIVNGVLLRALPYKNPTRLVRVLETTPQQLPEGVSLPNFMDWKTENNVFTSLSAYVIEGFDLTGVGAPQWVEAAIVSSNLLMLLRAQPVLGRSFSSQAGKGERTPVVVISYSLWQRQFGADPGIVGRTLVLDGKLRTIIGVMSPNFRFPLEARPVDLWVPLETETSTDRGAHDYFVIARLKPGVSLETARADMDTVARRLQQQYPQTNKGWGVRVTPLREEIVGSVRPALLVLLGAVGFLLLIACSNVANLYLARAAGRRREVAVRTALGGTRLRLIRQLLTESTLLAGLAGILGVALAGGGIRVLGILGPQAIPRLQAIKLDSRVLAFVLVVTLLTGVLFGLAPARQASNPDLNESLKEGGRSSTKGISYNRTQNLLVVAEIAAASVLLIGATLMIKSFVRLLQVNPGFNPNHLLTMQLTFPTLRYGKGYQRAAFLQQVLGRINTLPGVELAGAVSPLPLNEGFTVAFDIEGRLWRSPAEAPSAFWQTVSSGYFRAMAIPLLEGRVFTEQDKAGAPEPVIVNEKMAQMFWPGEDPVGRRMKISDAAQRPWRTIVGIVGNTKREGLDARAVPELYVPYLQRPSNPVTLVVRTAVDPASLTTAVRRQIWHVDKDQPVYNVRTMEDVISSSLAPRHFDMLLLGIFAAIALILASVGIYGVVSYSVSQRTHEIGIRIALGAQKSDVLRLVVAQGLTLAAIGAGIGIVGALGLTRFLSTLLYGVRATDPLTFAVVSAILGGVALFACYLPARRAAKVDPMVALRCE
jgi:putative ABC transport system permease protein